jgi:hypothetical protein
MAPLTPELLGCSGEHQGLRAARCTPRTTSRPTTGRIQSLGNVSPPPSSCMATEPLASQCLRKPTTATKGGSGSSGGGRPRDEDRRLPPALAIGLAIGLAALSEHHATDSEDCKKLRWAAVSARSCTPPGIRVRRSRIVNIDVLDREIFSEAEAARLLGVAQATLHYWLEGGTRRSKEYPPVIRTTPRDKRSVTWAEFVEAGMLRQYRRELMVPMHELRSFIDRLRDRLGIPYPLAHAQPRGIDDLVDLAGPFIWRATRSGMSRVLLD